jgi:hypothetical protein
MRHGAADRQRTLSRVWRAAAPAQEHGRGVPGEDGRPAWREGAAQAPSRRKRLKLRICASDRRLRENPRDIALVEAELSEELMERGLDVRRPLEGMKLGPWLGRPGVPNQAGDKTRIELDQCGTREVQIVGPLFELDAEAGREVLGLEPKNGDRPKRL